MGLLQDKVSVITGAGNGIGRSHALYFAKEGAKVVVNDLGGTRDGVGNSNSAADQVVAEIKAAGGQAVANYDNVATLEGGRKIVETAQKTWGHIDVLVNNAGILRDKSLLKMEEAQWDAVIAVHLKGTFNCTQAAAAAMKEAGHGGRIINTSSYSGLEGNFGQSNYGAAKAGIYGFTRVCSLELLKAGITVNCIAPVAKTRLTEDLPMFAGVTEEALGPQYISPVVAFLASDLAADITGKVLAIQGNWVYEYRMMKTAGARKDSGQWTPTELRERWNEITANNWQ
ncbi:MAG: SDR family NAD(P)-dependent oxidoreductase [Deltaproteobacteria bacterium]|nr:SDR family NAD(P)-dependent oxidoreductase [Deltaproteobacteria bacterium]